jgi:N-succinyldiaminopimelate aminotransferase
VLGLDEWKRLFDLSDRYGFVIASDECYSEIYFDEAAPPLGGCRRPIASAATTTAAS